MTVRIFGAPGRYIQGPGAIARLGEELSRLGDPVAIIADPVAQGLLDDTLRMAVPEARMLRFGGECTAEEIAARAAELNGASVVVGLGGGKAIDTAKGVAIAAGVPVAVVPTIASNDSPTSHIAVLYTPDHAVAGVRHMEANPALVLVDTAIIAGAPCRFLVAGIGDAMSKSYELAGARASGGLNFFGGEPTELTFAVADRCRQILLTDSRAALAAKEAGKPDAAFERVVEATILLSGLAFESGGLSIAHSMVRGFSVMPQLAHLMHGEMVALGTLVQLCAGQGDSDEIASLRAFFAELGLPVSLAALGVREDVDRYRIADVSLLAPYAGNYFKSLEAADMVSAMRRLDRDSAQ